MIYSISNIKRTFIFCLIQCILIPFFSLPAIWTQPPTLLSIPGNQTDQVNGVCLDVNASNNGVSAWVGEFADDSQPPVVYASSYTFGSGWSSATILTDLSTRPNGDRIFTDNANSQVSLNEANQAAACWQGSEFDIGSQIQFNGIFTETRNANGVWNSQQRASAFNITDPNFRTFNPCGAINDAGTFVVVWVERRRDDGVNTYSYMMANFQQVGGAWGTPTQIGGPFIPQGEDENTPDVEINSRGDVVVAWQRPTGGGFYTYEAVTYDAAIGIWSAVVSLDLTGTNQNGEYYNVPKVGIDEKGNAVAVWLWFDGVTTYRVYASSFTPGLGWGSRIILEEVDTYMEEPSCVMDRFGNTTVVWDICDDICEMRSSSLPLGGVWSAPVTISNPLESSFINYNMVQRVISADLEGNVIVIYRTNVGNVGSIYSVMNLRCFGWQSPELISSEALFLFQRDPINLNIGFGSCGFAIANWQAQINGSTETNQVWASVHFGLPVPPCNFIGTQCREKFALQSLCVNKLSWGSSCCNDSCTFFYNLYRNGLLIATIPANAPHVFDDSITCKGPSITYSLTSTDIFGVESPPVILVMP